MGEEKEPIVPDRLYVVGWICQLGKSHTARGPMLGQTGRDETNMHQRMRHFGLEASSWSLDHFAQTRARSPQDAGLHGFLNKPLPLIPSSKIGRRLQDIKWVTPQTQLKGPSTTSWIHPVPRRLVNFLREDLSPRLTQIATRAMGTEDITSFK